MFFKHLPNDRHSLRLVAALLTVYIVWGTTYYALALAMQSIPPVLMNGTRFLLAGTVMLAAARWQGADWPTALQWRNCAVVGLAMTFAAMGLTVLAQKMGIGSGLMATVVTSMPLWLALWTVLGGERVPRTNWLGLALGAIGALVLAQEGDFSTTLTGTLCAFGAPLCWSLGSWASRRLALPAPAMASGAQWLAGGLAGTLAALALEPGAAQFDPRHVSVAAAAAWVYLVVIGTLVTLNAYLWLLKNTSSALAGSYSFVNPLVALSVGVLLGGEHLTGWVYLAMPLILGALALILYGERAAALLRRTLGARAGSRLNLDSSVGRARVGRHGGCWQGGTTRLAPASKAESCGSRSAEQTWTGRRGGALRHCGLQGEQRRQRTPGRINRARSALTQAVMPFVAKKSERPQALGAENKRSTEESSSLSDFRHRSEIRPQQGQFLLALQPHSPAMGQKDGRKWAAAVELQPMLPKVRQAARLNAAGR